MFEFAALHQRVVLRALCLQCAHTFSEHPSECSESCLLFLLQHSITILHKLKHACTCLTTKKFCSEPDFTVRCLSSCGNSEAKLHNWLMRDREPSCTSKCLCLHFKLHSFLKCLVTGVSSPLTRLQSSAYYIRRSSDRGFNDFQWLQSKYTFSFAPFYKDQKVWHVVFVCVLWNACHE